METIELIVTALATGAALGVKDTASTAVTDAYASLKALVSRRLGREDSEGLLAGHGQDPTIWQGQLASELRAAKADQDRDLISAAKLLMNLMARLDLDSRRFEIQVREAQGLQIGDGNTQHNTF